jgi:hypothetical protein
MCPTIGPTPAAPFTINGNNPAVAFTRNTTSAQAHIYLFFFWRGGGAFCLFVSIFDSDNAQIINCCGERERASGICFIKLFVLFGVSVVDFVGGCCCWAVRWRRSTTSLHCPPSLHQPLGGEALLLCEIGLLIVE